MSLDERQECRDEQSTLESFLNAAGDGRVSFALMKQFQESARWDPRLGQRRYGFEELFGVSEDQASSKGGAKLSARAQRELRGVASRSHAAIDSFVLNFLY